MGREVRPAGADRRTAGGRADRGALPGRGPPAGPLPAGRAGRRPGGLGGRRRARARSGAARRRGRHRHRRRADPARPGRHPGAAGPAQGGGADRPDADAQRAGRRRRAVGQGQGRRARAGVGLRVRRRGARLGLPDDQVRRAGRRHRRRCRGLRAPAADGRLRPDAGDEHPQRRPERRVPAVRHRPRRVRARRGRRDHGAGAGRARRGPRREDLRPAGRHRHVQRRLPHHRPGPGRRGFRAGDRQGAEVRRPDPADIGHVNATPPPPRSATSPSRTRSCGPSATTRWSPRPSR